MTDKLEEAVFGWMPDEAHPAPKPTKFDEIRTDVIAADAKYNLARSNLPNIDRLAANIAEVGLLEPILVRPFTIEEWENEQDLAMREDRRVRDYAVVAGFRRFAAVQKLGWEFVPAIIRTDLDATRAKLINFAENFERQDLRLYDKMRTMAAFGDLGIKAKRITKETGIHEQTVLRYIRIWSRLAEGIKAQWSFIEDPAWEPSTTFLEKISVLADSEQLAAWKMWANNEEREEKMEEGGKPPPIRRRQLYRRPAKEIHGMIERLGKTEIDEAQKRALLWAMGRRDTL